MNLDDFKIEQSEDELYWEIFYYRLKVGEFSYMEESGQIWLNGCSIDENYQRKGLGCSMIQNAVEAYGEVYFCISERVELHQYSGDCDSRYLTEEGAALLNSCIRKGIVKEEWAKHPYRKANE